MRTTVRINNKNVIEVLPLLSTDTKLSEETQLTLSSSIFQNFSTRDTPKDPIRFKTFTVIIMNDAIENITIRKLQEEFMVLFFDILLVKPTYKITKFTDFETETDFQELT